MTLIRVEALNFVAGFVIEDGVVVEAAPILRRALMGKTADEARAIIKRKGWLAFHVKKMLDDPPARGDQP